METLNYGLLDRLGLASAIFYPRGDRSAPPAGASDHRVAVDPGIEVGCRFWPLRPEAPALLLFHGNGEVAGDYDTFAPAYHAIGASLLVADYRGYGASDGAPSFAALIADAHPVLEAFHALLDAGGFTGDRFLMGRSLGSLPAAELAATAPERLRGLVIESGAPELGRLPRRLGISPDAELAALIEGHAARMESIRLPLLQLHGEWDEIIPLDDGLAFHERVTMDRKELVLIPGAGHNDIAWIGGDRYFTALAHFLGTA